MIEAQISNGAQRSRSPNQVKAIVTSSAQSATTSPTRKSIGAPKAPLGGNASTKHDRTGNDTTGGGRSDDAAIELVLPAAEIDGWHFDGMAGLW